MTRINLVMLGRFQLADAHGQIDLSTNGRRLLAYLALAERPVRREHLAWTIWDDHTEARASACLRSALWRLPRPGGDNLVTADADGSLALADMVDVDWRRRSADAETVLCGATPSDAGVIDDLARELLPDQRDPWIEPHRERYRQLRLKALEAISAQHLAAGAVDDALDAATIAIAAAPPRESAHRCAVAAHFAAGDRDAATTQCRRFLDALAGAGLRPVLSAQLRLLLAEHGIDVRQLLVSSTIPCIRARSIVL